MKKLIFTLIVTLISLVSFSQVEKEVVRLTEVEKETFRKINEYRVKNGCRPITWSEEAYQAAYHHSYYLSDPNVNISHYERQNVDNIDEINSPGDRISNVLNSPSVYCVENVVTISGSDWWLYNRKDLNGKKIDGIKTTSDCILKCWVESSGHKTNMLDKTVDCGAVAIVREKNGDYCRPVMLFFKK